MAAPVLPAAPPPAEPLRGLCDGAVHLPGEPAYEAGRVPWNLVVDQRPAAVAYPATPDDVVAVVRAAAAAGLRVAPQGTGHNAGPLGDLRDVVLLRTSQMTGVTVDASACRVRVRAGTLWLEAVEAAAAQGLAVLHGSSPDVGVVGYSLGGGMGWYARALGLQANAITGAEIVTGDGRVLEVDADRHADLFWALRGGGGNVGIITALEFRAFPFDTAFAGMLVWDWRHARDVLSRWATWAVSAPDAATTALRLMQLPPIPEIPEPFRGRQLVIIDGAVLADDDEAAAIIAPLRELQPEVDTFARAPVATLARLHMDPEEPTPAVSQTATLASLPDEAIAALLEVAGPGSGSSLLMTELRQLGGALARPAAGAGALPQLDGEFVLFAAGMALSPEMGAQGHADAVRIASAMAPWDNGRRYLNFAEEPINVAAGYGPQQWARLQAIRSAADPAGTVLANHPVPRRIT